MPVLRFRVAWEEDDQVYRDIEVCTGQSFLEFHQTIIKAFEFDGKHSASFFESNDRWHRNREINSEVLINKKDAPSLSMTKTPVSALISVPDQKFVYVYDPVKEWTFIIELIGVDKEEVINRIYPFLVRKEGLPPAQYGVRGVSGDKLMEIEEKYDLGPDEMEDGYGDEGEDESGEGEETSNEEEFGSDVFDE